MITKETIIEAYVFLRKNNTSVPDETLDFMKDTALEKLQESKVKNCGLFSVNKPKGTCCSKCKEPMKRSVAQWVCINQLCSGEVQHDF